jgi:hypothetical protein
MRPIRKTNGTRGNTPAAALSHRTILNAPLADDSHLSVARKRAGFLGWSNGLMPTGIHRAPGGSSISRRRGTALKELN